MTPREEQILRALANDVRVLSLTQVARSWWSDTRWGRSRAKSAMIELESDGWAQLHTSLCRPIQQPQEALLSWSPGDASPDFWDLSRSLHQRAMQPASMTTFVFASAQSVALFGRGRAPSIKLTQMTHDLHVAEVYLWYRTNGLSARRWISEERLPHDWPLKVRPDAVVTDDDATIRCAIEYGGDYPRSRLEEMHVSLSSIELNYEIW